MIALQSLASGMWKCKGSKKKRKKKLLIRTNKNVYFIAFPPNCQKFHAQHFICLIKMEVLVLLTGSLRALTTSGLILNTSGNE